MNEHPQFDEDFDLYALGALDGDERESMELHLAHCEACAARLEESHGRVALLAFSAPPQVPPAEVRQHLLRRVHARWSARDVSAPHVEWFRRWAAWTFAAVALALAILYGRVREENSNLTVHIHELEAQQKQLQQQTERARAVLGVLTAPETMRVNLVKGGATPAPEGKAFYNPNRGLVFYAASMPALSPQKTYELWVIPVEGSPIPAGTFNPDSKGNGEVLLLRLPSGIAAKALAVTVEPSGGAPKPSGSPILVGAAS